MPLYSAPFLNTDALRARQIKASAPCLRPELGRRRCPLTQVMPRKSKGLAFQPSATQTVFMNMQTPMRHCEQSVSFDRRELNVILSLYGQMVAAGEWRDYGISCLRQYAVFSVFRRTAENPLYRIEKHPHLRSRQGMYAVIGMDGQILKRGHDLAQVLKVIERKMLRVIKG